MSKPPIQRLDMRRFATVRVSGALTEDAHLAPTMGGQPQMLLMLHFAPAAGLPYFACINLGVDPAAHAAAQAELIGLRCGALVSVGGRALMPCRDHDQDCLRVVDACAVVAFSDPIEEHTP